MIGVGAGLALTGRIPFVCSFACFVVGRFETIRISVAYTNANVKIVGTHSGIAIGEDGYSQMGLEDIACLRALPNIPIIQPADELETKQAVAFAVEHHGPALPPPHPPEPGAGLPARLSLPARPLARASPGPRRDAHRLSGGTVFNCLEAAKRLESRRDLGRGDQRRVIKPLDEELLLGIGGHAPAMW